MKIVATPNAGEAAEKPDHSYTMDGKVKWDSNSGKHSASFWEFPGVQWLGLGTFMAGALGSIPGRGTKILQATWLRGQKKKKKKFCQFLTNLNMDYPMTQQLYSCAFIARQWVFMFTHGNVCNNSSELETAQISYNRWMMKQ